MFLIILNTFDLYSDLYVRVNVFTLMYDQFNAPLLNKGINFFEKKNNTFDLFHMYGQYITWIIVFMSLLFVKLIVKNN